MENVALPKHTKKDELTRSALDCCYDVIILYVDDEHHPVTLHHDHIFFIYYETLVST